MAYRAGEQRLKLIYDGPMNPDIVWPVPGLTISPGAATTSGSTWGDPNTMIVDWESAPPTGRFFLSVPNGATLGQDGLPVQPSSGVIGTY